ncbi:MAG: MerR family transcriptional regulator, partial [Candidatus Kapabacteria bacterium]|nr:MerR family transcriptional regulator [Candidatus Kapabacteria bacterium]MDW7996829.1 MerR family transcriptional regulator [Bacteroidota bacterium]
QPHTLRHWERHLRRPRPRRGVFGERLYEEEDIATLRHIQHMLRVQRYTLQQAKGILNAERPSLSPEVAEVLQAALQILLTLLQPTSEASRA